MSIYYWWIWLNNPLNNQHSFLILNRRGENNCIGVIRGAPSVFRWFSPITAPEVCPRCAPLCLYPSTVMSSPNLSPLSTARSYFDPQPLRVTAPVAEGPVLSAPFSSEVRLWFWQQTPCYQLLLGKFWFAFSARTPLQQRLLMILLVPGYTGDFEKLTTWWCPAWG